MKKIYLLAFLSFISIQLLARDGYHIQLKLTDRKDSMVYLAHYFGKPFPTIYKADSAKLDKNGVAIFDHKEKIVGGIYIILPSDRKSYFEFLLDNGDDIAITAAIDDVPSSLKIKNSQENENFLAYQHFLKDFSKRQQTLATALTASKNKKDSTAINDQLTTLGKELVAYRKNYSAKYPASLLSSIFNALEIPEVPEGKHLLPNGKTDSSFAYHYYKAHYWDHFNFQDDRLIHTPLLQSKLDEYFNKLIYQEDSAIIAADTILTKMRGSENLFKFTLNWLSTNAQTSKIMGMDKLFVYLVDNYYMKGDATWLSSEELTKYIDRAEKIAPTIINHAAAELKAIDAEKKEQALYDLKAKYTLLIFYATDCGHCQHELPLIDSVYKAELKDKGVRVFAFNVERDEVKWREFIAKNHIEDWMNVWDPKQTSRYWALFDVQTTPTIYLLDENKIIRGKKLDHTNIAKVIDITEQKEKMSKR